MTGRSGRSVLPSLLVVIAVGFVAWAMLSPYTDGPSTPLGSDTPHHVWRMRLVAAEGLDALPTFRDSHLLNANGDRPGLPLFGAFIVAVGGPEAAGFAFVVPATLAAVIGLAAVAIGRRAVGDPTLATPLYALAAGLSLPVVFAANGPLEQLMASAMLLGAVAVLLPAAGGDRGAAAATVILLAGAWATHWVVTATVVAALATTALWLVVVPGVDEAVGGARRRAALRILGILGIAASVAIVASLLAPAAPQPPLGVTAEGVASNLDRQLPEYLRSALLLAAALGVAILAARRGRPRAALGPLLAWAAIPAAGVVLTAVVDDAPLHRLLSTALTIPVLAAAGAVGLGSLIRGHGGILRAVVGAVVALTIVGALAFEAYAVWNARSPGTQEKVAAQLAALGEAIGDRGTPVILVVDDLPGKDATGEGFGTVPALRRFRAALPAASIGRSAVYLGDPERLLAGEPTLRPDVPGYDEVSLDAWRAVEPLLDRRPTVVLVSTYVDDLDQIAAEHPAWVAAPWLLVAQGEVSPVPGEPPALAPPARDDLLGWTAWALLVPFLVGLGWSLVLGRGDLLGRIALAPALGLAGLVLSGLVAEALGVRVGASGTGLAVALGLTGVGTAIAILRRRTLSGATSG